MLKNYIKIAWRSLWKHRQTATINIVGLTIGMAAAVLITLWVQNESGFDSYHPGAENIYRIKTTLPVSSHETWIWESSPFQLGEMAKHQIPQVDVITRLNTTYNGLLLNYSGIPVREEKCAYVDEHWFDVFHYDLIAGSIAPFNQNPNSLIITQSAAKKYFGNAAAVGKLIKIDSLNYKVQAVVKDNPANSTFQYDVLLPNAARLADANEKKNDMSWGNYNYLTFVKLKPGANTAAVAKTLTAIIKNNKKDDKTTFSLINIKDIHFESDVQNSAIPHGNQKMVNVFAILAIVLMLTACINYVNLTTARASIRSKEVSIRKVVGADRSQLFGQFMAESFIITAVSLLLAVIVIQVSLPAFNAITEKHFTQPLANPSTWLILISALLGCTLLNGIYPALMLSSFHPLNVFRGESLLSINDAGLRKGLVVLQFTVSVVLIVATIVVYTQMRYMRNINLGFNKTQIFTFRIPWQVVGYGKDKKEGVLPAIRAELEQQSAFAAVGQAGSPIVAMDGHSSGNFDWDGRAKDFDPSFTTLPADDSFDKLMQLKMADGKWFSKGEEHNVVLNETAVKIIGLRKPYIGQRFKFQGDSGMVIGVVKDFHYQNLHEKIGPMVIYNHPQQMYTYYIKTRPGNTQSAISAAEKVWNKYVINTPFEFSFMDDKYNAQYRDEERLSTLISFFAGIAILISALGLLGLATFAAQQRIKEIGIRKVLGASVQHIVRLLSTDFVKMVVIASIIAFPIAWWAMSKWLQDFAYRIEISWWIFGLAGLSALIVAVVTVSTQAVRSALANPVKSLRSE